MPSMTVPLFGPSATVTSMVFGDLDGSSFCVPTWITSSPFLTVCLRPSKVRMSAFSSPTGSFSPPASLDSNVQVPWNFLTSFSRSAFSSARMPDPPDAAKPRAQSSATTEIRMMFSLTCRGQRYCCRTSLQLLVDLKLPSVHVVQQLIDARVHRTPRKDCKSREFSSNREAGSPIHIVNEVMSDRAPGADQDFPIRWFRDKKLAAWPDCKFPPIRSAD